MYIKTHQIYLRWVNKQQKPLNGLGQKPGKETTMKYTINMSKTEMKNLSNGFAALSKTVLNAILPQIDKDYAEVLSMTDISFDEFVDKLTSGGVCPIRTLPSSTLSAVIPLP